LSVLKAPPGPVGQPRGVRRVGVVALLLLAAFVIALPWVGCAWNPVPRTIDPTLLRICTFGFLSGAPFAPSDGLPGFTGPY
jgi:hypothetical protein